MSSAGQRFLWGPAWETYYFQFWDKTQIVNRIRSLAARGQAVNFASVGAAGEWQLLRAAAHYFGSWPAALKAAGFKYDAVRADIKWTRKKVILSIRKLRRSKADIASRSVQIRDPALFAGAVRKRLFGSWEKAIEESGFDYADVRKYERWSDDRLRREIRRLEANGVRLNAKNVLLTHPHIYYAACHRHASWGKTLRALGFDHIRHAVRRPWKKMEIVEGLRDLARNGVHMSDNNVRDVNPTLHAAACRAWGRWTVVRARIGMSGARIRPPQKTGYLPGLAPRAERSALPRTSA